MPNERARSLARCTTTPPRPRPRPPLPPVSLLHRSASKRRNPRGNVGGGGRPRLSNPGVREIPRADRSRGLSPRRAAAPPLVLAGSFGWQLGASSLAWLPMVARIIAVAFASVSRLQPGPVRDAKDVCRRKQRFP
jgi:hypothetical protein